ncbi:MAG: tRNA (cytidine(34)-2'-O)-methyltransferase [Candidatus Cloacimonetes bacterium]|nr:tRNA (cytidine(34)-2'-O)-methyltransferase [Candidatus Cloacimonadota bacterium]
MAADNALINLGVALYQPEIPANTGNIGRLCLGVGSELHIIKPMRFLCNDKYLKRAGLDYWSKMNVIYHDGLNSFLEKVKDRNVYFYSTRGTRLYSDVRYLQGDLMVFGPESRGLPREIIEDYSDRVLCIPMRSEVRSINLANSVAIVLYEAWRQLNFYNDKRRSHA